MNQLTILILGGLSMFTAGCICGWFLTCLYFKDRRRKDEAAEAIMKVNPGIKIRFH